MVLSACAVWADDDAVYDGVLPDTETDTESALSVIEADTELALPAVKADTGSVPPVRDIDYTGAKLSAFIPGGGQFYQGRYWQSGLFIAAETFAFGYMAYWWNEARRRTAEAGRLRDSSDIIGGHLDNNGYNGTNGGNGSSVDDSLTRYLAGWYGVVADRMDFEARQARFTAYSALAWALGVHLYGFMDALEAGGLAARGEYRDPTRAGLLAAVPFLGLGQLYNSRPRKAGMMAMAQSSLIVMAYGHHRLMSDASSRYNQMRDPQSPQYAYRAEHLSYWNARYDREFSRRNTYLWAGLFTYIYSIFDAVVDAHLSDYETKIHLGTDLVVGGPGGPGTTMNLNLTYRF
jgi:TM2 domain-containing membrane protein YozV